MKKIIGLTLATVLTLSLAACGSSNSSSTAGTSAPSGGKDTLKIALAHIQPAVETAPFHQSALLFKETVEKETNGKVTVEIHPNGELGAEREMIEAVQLNTINMAIVSTGPLGNFAAKSNVFDFPFLFKNRDHANKVLDGEVGNEVAAQVEQSGLSVLAWSETGFRSITNSKRPITKPEDLKGIKIRTMENKVHIDSFKTFGADPTPMAFTELFTSMQQGIVDGQENPLSIIVPQKFYEAQKYMTISNHFYSPAVTLFNKKILDGLTPETKQIITNAAHKARDFERDFIKKMDEQYLETARKNGMNIVMPEQFDYDAFLAASKPVYAKYDKEYGELIRKIQAVK
jgi:tripartite ATP-independent transporter DctP family solute receptor